MPAFAKAEPYKRYKMPSLEPGEIRDVIEFILVTGGKPKGGIAFRARAVRRDRGKGSEEIASDEQRIRGASAPSQRAQRNGLLCDITTTWAVRSVNQRGRFGPKRS
jgi:hypothetical protein